MRKRLLSTLLALCVVLALVPAASTAGVEDFKYIKFSNKPNSSTPIKIVDQSKYIEEDEYFDYGSFTVWVFPDDTTHTITIPDGGSVLYVMRGGIPYIDFTWGLGDVFAINDFADFWPVEGSPTNTRTFDFETSWSSIVKWSVYNSDEYNTVVKDGVTHLIPVGELLEEIYICKQSEYDFLIAEGLITVEQTVEPEQPTTPTTPADTKAVLSPQGLKVDGKDIDCEKYNIADRNYFKLRDLAQLLSGTGSQFQVGYDEETKTVSITTGQAYTPNGTELLTGVDNSATAQTSNQTIMVNGEIKEDLTVYNIGGSNFFQLRELGNILGFEVDYDQATNTAVVNSVEK